MRRRFAWPLASFLVLFAAPAFSRTLQQAASNVRWCLPAPNNATLVAACTAAVALADSAAVNFSCVAGGSPEGCLELISNGGAELTTLGGATMLDAHETFALEPLAAEFYGDLAGASYYSVAVVPKELCSDSVTFADLKGKRSCHTGYRRTAGWTLPVGYLTENSVIPIVNSNAQVQADAESVAAFFSATCAAGSNDQGPLVGGGAWQPLCTACKGNCDATDPYYDYPGTVRCVMEGAGDVAFTKHSTPLEVASDGTEPQPWSTKSKADLMLLCPSGGCKPLEQYESCHIAKAPAYAVMASAQLRSSALGQSIQQALTQAGSDPAFLNATRDFGGIQGFPFSSDTQGILAVDVPFLEYFGASTKQAYDGITELESAAPTPANPAPTTAAPTPTPTTAAPTPTPTTAAPTTAAPAAGTATTVRWCIPFAATAADVAACKAAVSQGNSADVAFDCIPGGSRPACVDMVASGAADLIVLGGSDMLPAHQEHQLEPIAAEYYGDLAGASYYSVAVVPKEFCSDSVTFADLRGKRSCHTGYRRTAGWTLPVGYLTETGVIPRVDDNDKVQADAESIAAFFSATCAAGSNDVGPALGGGTWDGMCTACKGSCDSSDPYYDYPGTLRCVMEGAGDVAFTKHNTPLEVASDGTEPQPWSTKSKADLMLLCPSGGCAPLDQFESCNIAKAPARAVMSRAEMQGSALGAKVKKALADGGATLAAALIGISNQSDFLLGADTKSLLAVDVPFQQYFGASTQQAYEGMTALDELASAQQGAAATTSSSGGSGVSSGAAAGIGIGCAVAGALIGAVVAVLVTKRRAGWQPHSDAGAPVIPGQRAGSESWASGKL